VPPFASYQQFNRALQARQHLTFKQPAGSVILDDAYSNQTHKTEG
jgi:hypothetical protein